MARRLRIQYSDAIYHVMARGNGRGAWGQTEFQVNLKLGLTPRSRPHGAMAPRSKSLASYLNIPLVIGDATSLTEAGYVGDDVESLLSKLILAAEGDIEVAQRGIIYIDEIDKIQRSGSGFKDLRLGVQHALLKLLEGTIATVPPLGCYKHSMQPGVPFDTTSCSSVAGRS